ncbi:MAG: hypothetical protein RBU29_07545 [bacterium]|jgi:hypothetical protein|nr:hypothetical protein [bacterium]
MRSFLQPLALLLCLWLCIVPGQTEETATKLFKDSFTFFQLLRQENGIYRDALRFDGNHFHPASIATTGMGLVSLCIADRMGWIANGAELAETTLRSLTGQPPTFHPDRNAAGYFRHWLDLKTGARAWNSEYSSIDTAILVCGANFCKNYFSSPTIQTLVQELMGSIQWRNAIADPTRGTLYRELDAAGNGLASKTTTPYSEYILVAWLAWNEERQTQQDGPATALWTAFYATRTPSMTHEYQGHTLLTDQPGRFQSHFTVLFPYYLCHEYTVSTAYRQFMSNARQADQAWFALQEGRNPWEWGLGAGSVGYGSGYHADAIHNNSGIYCSPHIIAGFLPVYPEGLNDLLQSWDRRQGVHALPASPAQVLWRHSVQNRTWRAQDIQGVDYATLLFGLATLPEHAGSAFFQTFNALAIDPSSAAAWKTQ